MYHSRQNTCHDLPVYFNKDLEERGYGILGTRSVVNELADAYEELLFRIIKPAEYESKLNALLPDLERTQNGYRMHASNGNGKTSRGFFVSGKRNENGESKE